MTDVIYANGCSFTAGSELEQDPEAQSEPSATPADINQLRSRWAWPQILGHTMRAKTVINEARGGGSNARAVRMTYDFVSDYLGGHHDPRQLLVVIGITDIARNEYRDRDGTWQLLKPNLASRSNRDRASRSRNSLYYDNFHDPQHALTMHTHQFAALHAFLNAQLIPHHFHEAMPNNATAFEQHPEATAVLTTINTDAWHGLRTRPGAAAAVATLNPAQSFEQWAQHSGLLLGTEGHPLKDGHSKWAHIIADRIVRSP